MQLESTTHVVSLNTAQARCTRYSIMWSRLSVTYDRSVVFSGYSVFSTTWTSERYYCNAAWKNSLKTPKGKSESVYCRRTANTMARRKSTKGQTTIYKRGVVVVVIVFGIYSYLCNQCASLHTLLVWIPLRRGVLDTALCDHVSGPHHHLI
jgi:hypothetical protein